jgi:OFA family oxalate/formate antiporter-like MFS transporter
MEKSMETKNYNRLIPVLVVVAVQLCMGIGYIWSVFQSYLIITETTPNAMFHWPATYGTFAYALLMGLLSVGAFLGGFIQKKYSIRGVLVIAGIVMGSGFFLAQYTTEARPWVLWLSYGVLGGIGAGMPYTNSISVCQKWFPDKKGVIGGVVVSSLGFGGLVFTPVCEKLIQIFGILQTFKILGVISLIVCIVGSFFIKNPPEGYIPKGWSPPVFTKDGVPIQDFTTKEMLKTPQFYLISLVFICATSAGLMLTPMAKVFGLQPDSGLTKEAAIAAVMIITMSNALGRIFWGGISDRIGRKNALRLLLIITVISIITVAFTRSYLMLAMIGMVGFTFGGFLGTFPSLAAEYWGTKNMPTNYGLLLCSFSIGIFASSHLVAVLSEMHEFETAFVIAAIAAVVGLIILQITKPPRKKMCYEDGVRASRLD